MELKKGDKLKVIEELPHRKTKTTIGEVIQLDRFKITIVVLKNNVKTSNTSYNIADCKSKDKKFFIENNGEWKRIKINITEYREGEKVVI
jgi:hypothetical protein